MGFTLKLLVCLLSSSVTGLVSLDTCHNFSAAYLFYLYNGNNNNNNRNKIIISKIYSHRVMRIKWIKNVKSLKQCLIHGKYSSWCQLLLLL